jgi:hypothetical protein
MPALKSANGSRPNPIRYQTKAQRLFRRRNHSRVPRAISPLTAEVAVAGSTMDRFATLPLVDPPR